MSRHILNKKGFSLDALFAHIMAEKAMESISEKLKNPKIYKQLKKFFDHGLLRSYFAIFCDYSKFFHTKYSFVENQHSITNMGNLNINLWEKFNIFRLEAFGQSLFGIVLTLSGYIFLDDKDDVMNLTNENQFIYDLFDILNSVVPLQLALDDYNDVCEDIKSGQYSLPLVLAIDEALYKNDTNSLTILKKEIGKNYECQESLEKIIVIMQKLNIKELSVNYLKNKLKIILDKSIIFEEKYKITLDPFFEHIDLLLGLEIKFRFMNFNSKINKNKCNESLIEENNWKNYEIISKKN